MIRLIAKRCQDEGTDIHANDVIHNPFRSARQRRFMYAKYPKIAKRWTKKYGSKIRK